LFTFHLILTLFSLSSTRGRTLVKSDRSLKVKNSDRHLKIKKSDRHLKIKKSGSPFQNQEKRSRLIAMAWQNRMGNDRALQW
jgi:hypothetical protein